jgi:hypothetical protein
MNFQPPKFGLLFQNLEEMKVPGSLSVVQRCRNREIYYIYQQLRRTYEYTSLSNMCERIAEMPVSRYYLSENRGLAIYQQYLRTADIECKSPYKMALYKHFVNECELHRGKRLIDKVRRALDVQAPCLGLSPSRIHTILSKLGAK